MANSLLFKLVNESKPGGPGSQGTSGNPNPSPAPRLPPGQTGPAPSPVVPLPRPR